MNAVKQKGHSYECPNRQLPILPCRLQPSTFGVYVLNYCVRNGNRWNHIAIATGYIGLPLNGHLLRCSSVSLVNVALLRLPRLLPVRLASNHLSKDLFSTNLYRRVFSECLHIQN